MKSVFLAMGIVLLLFAGAASAEQYVQVDYSGEVIGSNSFSYASPDVGKEFLLVDITIASHGYDDVFTNPNRFQVEVNNVKYGYDTASHSLENIGKPILDTDAHLGNGGQISGYLVFQIPAGATNWVLVFDGGYPRKEVRYNNTAGEQYAHVDYSRQTSTGEQYVQVDYSGGIIGSNSFSYASPDVGKEFLLVDITIASHGYDDVFTNPNRFQVEVNNVKYGYDTASHSLENIGKPILDTDAHLGDGGQISGYLVFQIPAGATNWVLVFDGGYPRKEVRYNNT